MTLWRALKMKKLKKDNLTAFQRFILYFSYVSVWDVLIALAVDMFVVAYTVKLLIEFLGV